MIPTKDIKYRLNDAGEFVITNYNTSKLFSSFFPGLAGKEGIPMWLFYVNRGQCVCSMGIEGKHKPVMEFLPANWAYNLVSSQGFRTFLKIKKENTVEFYEPFQRDLNQGEMDIEQEMIIKPAGLSICEINKSLGLKFTVEYNNVPHDSFAGLIRELTIENIGSSAISFDVLDGLPLIVPYGLDNTGLKFLRRLFEAFVEVTNFENKVPFFKGKVEPADRPDVVRIKEGNFYLGFTTTNGKTSLVNPIVDPVHIFGNRGDYKLPEAFLANKPEDIIANQILENRLPSAMGLSEVSVNPEEAFVYISVIGHADSVDELNRIATKVTQEGYIEAKRLANHELIKKITQNNFVCSEEAKFNHYSRQNFLDNTLRGGLPYTIKGKDSSTTLHLFSRKHGDLERDYNDFRLMPTHYSQGNGNYRDVNQNRRCDLFFNPDVKDSNIKHFYNLIQLDGFNPLVIKEIRFSPNNNEALNSVLTPYLSDSAVSVVAEKLQSPFTPGELLTFMKKEGIEITGETEHFLGDLMGVSSKKYDTEYGESFWTDHWTYNLDLIENYLAIYPEAKEDLIFHEREYTYYDNAHLVAPRRDKYVIWDGNMMQLNSVVFDEEKDNLIKSRAIDPNKVHTNYGLGDVYYTTLFNKMLCLITNKLASLDGSGIGIEMESDKPNWYDALNGLPGLIGSSLSETLEVKRHIAFMLNAIDEYSSDCKSFTISEEVYDYIESLDIILKEKLSPFEYWDKATTLKEQFRNLTRLGISGKDKEMSFNHVTDFLKSGLRRVEDGISKAWNSKQNVISTYFINKVTKHELIYTIDNQGQRVIKRNAKGLPCFKALEFESIHLPLFLEGPVHFLRSSNNTAVSRNLVKNIKKSGLFDTKLKMYKVNECLASQPLEIGRARTFSPGWFENESIWLHMEYKYMLEVLRNGLYDEFFEDFKNVFIPFLDPAVYGRSVLENSSFLVSSSNPDPSIHGNGFVSRLSGATAEFISILMHMATGRTPFSLNKEGKLRLEFKPVLPEWLFTKSVKTRNLFINGKWESVSFPIDSFSFMYLGEVLVIYHNPKRGNTYGDDCVKPVNYELKYSDGNTKTVSGLYLTDSVAMAVRGRDVKQIDVHFE